MDRHAPPMRRLWAATIDAAAAGVVPSIVLFLGAVNAIGSMGHGGGHTHDAGAWDLAALVSGAAGALYWLTRDGRTGPSLGKRMTGLCVVTQEAGGPCGWAKSVFRNAIYLVSTIVFPLLVVQLGMMVGAEGGRTLADRIAKTRVRLAAPDDSA